MGRHARASAGVTVYSFVAGPAQQPHVLGQVTGPVVVHVKLATCHVVPAADFALPATRLDDLGAQPRVRGPVTVR